MKPANSGRTSIWPVAFLLLLALLQLGLVPLVAQGDINLAPLFRVDSLGILFGTVWTLMLGAISFLFTRRGRGYTEAIFLSIIGIDLLVYTYAHNMMVMAVGWGLAGVGVWAITRESSPPGQSNRAMLSLLSSAIILATLAVVTGFPTFIPPAGGVVQPWPATAVVAGALAVVASGGWGLLVEGQHNRKEVEQRAGLTLKALYALAAPYILAKMLVTAPWHPIGTWLLVLLGMLTLLIGVYTAYESHKRGRTRVLVYAQVGITLVGFGIAANSPLAAVGATWVMLAGLLWVVTSGWRWAGVRASVAAMPGLWMVSQAALDTGYVVVSVLLLPLYILVVALTIIHDSGARRSCNWWVAIPIAVSITATALSQLVVEVLLRPAVRTMAGGVGALTVLAIDWGVGMTVRTPSGGISAALPATGIALAVFLTAVALYWLKQLAWRAINQANGDTQAE